MPSINSAQLLHIWETTSDRQPHQAALVLLQATVKSEEQPLLSAWTIGQRDRRLLQLRAQLFGKQMESIARCPHCGESVEMTFTTDDLIMAETDDIDQLVVAIDGYQITHRLPTIADLTTIAATQSGRRGLLIECVVAAQNEKGETLDNDDLPTALLDQLSARMEEADPQANIEFDLNCPVCAAQWQAPFDIVGFLLQEIDTWARRLMREIHLLAGAYGWTETEILKLSPTRRRSYLEMILGGS